MPWMHEIVLAGWDNKPVTVGVDTDGDLGLMVEIGLHDAFSIIVRHDQVDKLRKWLFARGEFKCLTCNGTRQVSSGITCGGQGTEDMTDPCPDCKNVPLPVEQVELRFLTRKQADHLRIIRPYIAKLEVALSALTGSICQLCDHDPFDPACPSCHLWQMVCDMKGPIDEFSMDFDRILGNGPVPKGAK